MSEYFGPELSKRVVREPRDVKGVVSVNHKVDGKVDKSKRGDDRVDTRVDEPKQAHNGMIHHSCAKKGSLVHP